MYCYESNDSQICLNLSRFTKIRIVMILKQWYDTMKYKIWANLTHFFDYNYKLIPWITSSKSSNQKLEFIQPWVTQRLIWSWNDQQDNWTLRSHLSWWLAIFSFIRIQIIFFPHCFFYNIIPVCSSMQRHWSFNWTSALFLPSSLLQNFMLKLLWSQISQVSAFFSAFHKRSWRFRIYKKKM